MIQQSPLEASFMEALRPRTELRPADLPPRPSLIDRLLHRNGTVDGAGLAPDVAIVIRKAREADALPIARLAALDGRKLPAGARVVAEADGRIVAAADVSTGAAIADPFKPTAPLVSLLRMRASQLRVAEGRR
jgi:hypothetical protein